MISSMYKNNKNKRKVVKVQDIFMPIMQPQYLKALKVQSIGFTEILPGNLHQVSLTEKFLQNIIKCVRLLQNFQMKSPG